MIIEEPIELLVKLDRDADSLFCSCADCEPSCLMECSLTSVFSMLCASSRRSGVRSRKTSLPIRIRYLSRSSFLMPCFSCVLLLQKLSLPGATRKYWILCRILLSVVLLFCFRIIPGFLLV